ncbi:hypothetical protein ACFPN2_22340 [Steroidobacter flavus]|uniref:Uncharacterized protein n=1 Tax=Steroidobacter flavus TaxID=1842136 RepID=A0ABV8SWE1_9GAMM
MTVRAPTSSTREHLQLLGHALRDERLIAGENQEQEHRDAERDQRGLGVMDA